MSNIPIYGTEMLDVIIVVVVDVASRLCIPMLVDGCKSATLVFTGCLCVMIVSYLSGVTFTSVTIIPSLHTCSIQLLHNG